MSEDPLSTAGEAPPAPEKPKQGGPRNLIALVFLLILLPVLAGVLCVKLTAWGQDLWAKLTGENEPQAIQALKDFGALVIGHEGHAYSVNFVRKPVDDGILVDLRPLRHLETVDLTLTQINDEQLRFLAGLRSLVNLTLNDTPVSDAGLVHLQGLQVLSALYLSGTKVSDAGLVHLAGLRELKMLNLSKTQVTDEGMKYLVEMDLFSHLLLENANITDAGLDQLPAMKEPKRKRVTLTGTKVTAAGVARLKAKNEGLSVDFSSRDSRPDP